MPQVDVCYVNVQFGDWKVIVCGTGWSDGRGDQLGDCDCHNYLW